MKPGELRYWRHDDSGFFQPFLLIEMYEDRNGKLRWNYLTSSNEVFSVSSALLERETSVLE
jgi:hypothetical protein